MRLSDAIRGAQSRGVTPIIGEVKVRSPRDNDLLRDRNPVEYAIAMADAGVIAISVVTERERFGGSVKMLHEIRQAVDLPVLRKDFINSEAQVHEEESADALLLIYSMLGYPKLKRLHSACLLAGMEPLIEVHTKEEALRTNALKPLMVGINNRNIGRLETDDGNVSTTKELAPYVEDAIIVSESSFNTRREVEEALGAGADAVLIGTALLNAMDLNEKLQELLGR